MHKKQGYILTGWQKCHEQKLTGTYSYMSPSSNGSTFMATLQNLTTANNEN